MASFKDEQGTEWVVSLDALILDELIGQGLDIADIDGGGLFELERSAVKLVKSLIVVCREQRNELSLTAEQFAKRLKGEALTSALEAVRQALEDFFPASQWFDLQSRLVARRQMHAELAPAVLAMESMGETTSDFRVGMMQGINEAIKEAAATASQRSKAANGASATGPTNTPPEPASA